MNSNEPFFNFISSVINSITYEIISIPYVMKKITSVMNAVTYEIIFITDGIEKISHVVAERKSEFWRGYHLTGQSFGKIRLY
jgi:uncharacterized protein with von Willebrand factor type A (vWA) domain